MNDKTVIAQKIINDATEQANLYIEQTQSEIEQQIALEKANAEALVQKAEQEAAIAGELLVERTATIARLDGKKVMLNAKQKLVQTVFSTTLECFKRLDEKQYFTFVLGLIEKYAEKGDRVILDKNAPFTPNQLENTEVFANKQLTCSLGDDFGGGILLQGRKRDADLSFVAIVKQKQSALSGEVAKQLFD